MDPKVIIVFGATGVQGKGFCQWLSKHPDSYTIYALTRSPTSSASKYLSSLPSVKIIQVDPDCMDNPMVVFRNLENQGVKTGGVYGVFSVQGYVDDKTKYRQGCAIGNVASRFGVKHFVQSSSDFGDLDDCGIAGYEVCRQVENHLKTLSMPATFIRPPQFMDIWLPTTPFQFKMGRTAASKFALKPNPTRKHCLVAGEDVGRAAAEAIIRGPGWSIAAGGREESGVVRVCGEGLTIQEIEKVYKEEIGSEVPYAPIILVTFVRTVIPIIRQVISFFGNHGYNINVEQVRRELPWVMDYRTFLRRHMKGELL